MWQLSFRIEVIKTTRRGHKIFINPITQYSPRSLPHNVYIAHTTNRIPEKNAFSRIAFSSLVKACWIDEMASNPVPFTTIFNLGNKKIKPVLNQGSRVDGITRGPAFRQKLGENTGRMRRSIVVQKIPGPTSLKLRPNAINSRDQSLVHILTKFTVKVCFQHKFVVNDTFSIKKRSQQCFQPRFLHSRFLSLCVPFMSFKITCSR
jgi:hypothetical protein